jgi:hypothetical protein
MVYQLKNVNPKGKKVGDCVIRAIAEGLNLSWYKVYDDLVELGRKKCAPPNDKVVFRQYLKNKGLVQQKQERHSDNTKYTVGELIDKYSDKTLIISCAHHLTVAVKGTLYDLWNCSDKIAGVYWIVPDSISITLEEFNKNLVPILDNMLSKL